jgi:hypothetical protein
MLEDDIGADQAGDAETQQQTQKTEDNSLHDLSNRSWKMPRPFRPEALHSASPVPGGRGFICRSNPGGSVAQDG